jgi:RNA polymerase sigma factor (sigma-70 family)
MAQEFSFDLLYAFNHKDPAAFRAIFNFYYKRITYYIFQIVGEKNIAEDIAQESFIKLFLQKIRQFERIEDVGRYLYAIARNASCDYIKAKRKERKLFDDNRGIDMDRIGNGINIFEQNDPGEIEVEVLSLLCEAIEGLPTQCRIVWTKLFEGMKVSEMAIELKVSPDTIRSQKRRGLKLIKQIVKNKTSGKGLLIWCIILMVLYEIV